MPNCFLKTLSHGILMGKILSALAVVIPLKTHSQDKPFQSVLSRLEDINKAIKCSARTNTKTLLTDKVS